MRSLYLYVSKNELGGNADDDGILFGLGICDKKLSSLAIMRFCLCRDELPVV